MNIRLQHFDSILDNAKCFLFLIILNLQIVFRTLRKQRQFLRIY